MDTEFTMITSIVEKKENYKDLVFHGPLQATLLLRASERLVNKKAKSLFIKDMLQCLLMSILKYKQYY